MFYACTANAGPIVQHPGENGSENDDGLSLTDHWQRGDNAGWTGTKWNAANNPPWRDGQKKYTMLINKRSKMMTCMNTLLVIHKLKAWEPKSVKE